MSKFVTVMMHTYRSKIKSKPFIITTLITIALLFVVTNMNEITKLFGEDDAAKVGVIDKTGDTLPALQAQLKQAGDDVKLESYKKSESEAEKAVIDGKLDGLLVLEKDASGIVTGKYKAEDVTQQSLITDIENALQQIKNKMAAETIGLNQEQLAAIYLPVSFEKESLSSTAKSEEEAAQVYILVYVVLFFMYMTVMMYGSMIAVEVATEKSSRVMEILISSVSPVKQMFGKIFGIVLIALTQLVLFIAGGLAAVKLNENLSGSESIIQKLNLNEIPISLVVYALVFFILGFFLYATLFAMMGSLISRVEEVNNLMTPVVIVIVAAFMIAMYGRENPESVFVTAASYFPLFTPMLMLLRVGMLSLPVWEIALGIGVLVGAIVLFAMIGARVYRGGVLMYGNAPSLKLFKQALLLSKQEKRDTTEL
ncbi:ABC transporter permease [Fictibacillus phosphorivorans]|uniref:ABC transporter permease n=1 Tax=Fictibacillus phosphorivorans TaxID=1221500 RepID=UPI002041BE2E|nr:ABC transporter permease [Fictibacillus phosphorivorans]MCM3717510.1 ABC transporter permease [Fictibacillus phosphorivorans]MCM3775205.1 ABC transporter permease [Fictibacillus phosphorivorans]